MNPGLGVILFGGLGYILVYASVANRGRFATHPWAGVIADAYTSPASSSSSSGPDVPATPSAASSSSKAPATVKQGRSALGEAEHVLGRILGGIPLP